MALSSVAQQQMQIIDSGQQQSRNTNSNISHSQKHQMPIVIQTQQQPIHFDQALGYLNKIKVKYYQKWVMY
jgi:histone deacetylase complex regulatory component SIN3